MKKVQVPGNYHLGFAPAKNFETLPGVAQNMLTASQWIGRLGNLANQLHRAALLREGAVGIGRASRGRC